MQRTFAMPPRHVPLTLRIANQFNSLGLLGWFLLGFSSIFVWTFLANADFSFVTFRGDVARATGRITQVQEAGAKENDQPVIANHYAYSVAGRAFNGVAYALGEGLPVGQSVDVEYIAADPAKSRIPGMRRGMFGPAVFFVAIFPLIGILMAFGAFRWGSRRNHLLRHGVFTTGVFKEKNPTNMRVNKRLVWELVFEFTARDGQRYQATASTTDPDSLEDERQEPLLYDPDDPSRAYLLDEAPARPRLDENGELVGRPTAFARLLLPLIVIAANAYVIF